MNRMTAYLAGVLVGGTLGISIVMGHDNQWIAVGPILGCVLGFLSGGLLILVAALNDEDN